MSTPDRQALQRLRYWQGQMLRSQDFRDQAATEAQLRWWHNRALHNTFGVAGGLEVELLEISSSCFVRVHSGLAYDCFGRELIHPRDESIPVPLTEGGMTLLARYKDNRLFLRAEEISGVCSPRVDALFEEQLELSWKPSASLDVRDGVPLAQVIFATLDPFPITVQQIPEALRHRLYYDAGRKILIFLGVMSSTEKAALLTLSSNSPFQKAVQSLFQWSQAGPVRQFSRPLARPYLRSGATIAGQTAWEAWSIPTPFNNRRNIARESGQLQIGFQVQIDTSAAGFTRVPYYFAWLQGDLWTLSAADVFVGMHWDHIEDVSIDGFTFRFVVLVQHLMQSIERSGSQEPPLPLQQKLLHFLQSNGFFVSWLGMQPEPGHDHASDTDEVHRGHS